MLSPKVKNTLKQGVMNNEAYTLKAINANIKLNQNESPFDFPKELKEKVLDTVKNSNWNIYPDFVPEKVYKKCAAYFGVNSNNILIGNGSNEMITTILAGTVETGTKVILPTPTFSVYSLVASNLNGTIQKVMLNSDFSFNISEIINECKTEGSVTILCSPNNPTGTSVSVKDIIKITEASNGIVVVDEAYSNFAKETVIELIEKYDNLIILKTLSKAAGLAGVRLGIMISNEELITELSKVKLPYNLDIFSLSVLEMFFDNPGFITETIKVLNDEKNRMISILNEIDQISVVPSNANFFLIKVDKPQDLFKFLLKKDILVRDVTGYPMLESYLRISVGNEEQNDKLLDAINNYFLK